MITVIRINKVLYQNINTGYYLKYLLINLLLLISVVANAAELDATLAWSQKVELSTPVNGVVQQVFAQPGKIAAKGEILVQIDPRGFNAQLKYTRAQLESAEQISAEAKRELEREQDMYDRTMLSDHDLQIAKNNNIAALAKFQQAKSEFTQAKLNVEYSAIRAPFNAIIIETRAVKGQVVSSAISPPVLVVVAEAHRMLARTYVNVDTVSSFVLNQGVTVKVGAKTYQGKISNIGMETDSKKQAQYAVDVIFDYGDELLRAGQPVKVEI
jgi:multidrug efflux system membrane fusion protein